MCGFVCGCCYLFLVLTDLLVNYTHTVNCFIRMFTYAECACAWKNVTVKAEKWGVGEAVLLRHGTMQSDQM